jgi:hypothetical protein
MAAISRSQKIFMCHYMTPVTGCIPDAKKDGLRSFQPSPAPPLPTGASPRVVGHAGVNKVNFRLINRRWDGLVFPGT